MAYTPTANITEGTWDAGNPDDLNYLRPNTFKFQVHNLPNVSFFCQSANIPAINMSVAEGPTPLHDLPYPGEKVRFGELNIRFLIQEKMANYTELFNWLVALGNPEKTEQYTNYVESQAYRYPGSNNKKKIENALMSDVSLFVLSSDNNPTIEIKFRDAFPTSLSGLDFDTSSGDTSYFQGLASFAYRQYEIIPYK